MRTTEKREAAPGRGFRASGYGPIPTCRDGERRSVRCGRPGAAPRQAWPNAAPRTAPRWRTKVSMTSPRRRSSRRFFSTDRALDRSWMHINAEFHLNQLRQFTRPDWLARRELRDEKRQHVALNLMWTVWTSLLRHQARNAPFVEIRFGLVKGRARDAILVRHVCDRSILDRDAAQHLVFYLYNIARIEESAFLKLRIADLVGRRIQGAVFGKGVGLRALAIVACWHVELRSAGQSWRKCKYAAN